MKHADAGKTAERTNRFVQWSSILVRCSPSGRLDSVERNLIEKWFRRLRCGSGGFIERGWAGDRAYRVSEHAVGDRVGLALGVRVGGRHAEHLLLARRHRFYRWMCLHQIHPSEVTMSDTVDQEFSCVSGTLPPVLRK